MYRNDNCSTFIISGSLGLTTAIGKVGADNPGMGRGRRGGGPSEEQATIILAPRNSKAYRLVPMAGTALAIIAFAVLFGSPNISSVVTAVLVSVATN